MEVESEGEAMEWTYEGYWATVIGAYLEPGSVLDEWLTAAEVEAWREGNLGGALPAEWRGFHARALEELGHAP